MELWLLLLSAVAHLHLAASSHAPLEGGEAMLLLSAVPHMRRKNFARALVDCAFKWCSCWSEGMCWSIASEAGRDGVASVPA